MDGTLAVLFFMAGLGSAAFEHCGGAGCLAPNEPEAFNTFSLGAAVFQEEAVSTEFYFRRDTGIGYGPVQVTYGASVTTEGELWAGAGFVTSREWDLSSGVVFGSLSFLPGLYAENGGIDLGGPIEFRSGIEVGYETDRGLRFSLSLDHRSNGGIYDINPGIETVHFRIGIPIR